MDAKKFVTARTGFELAICFQLAAPVAAVLAALPNPLATLPNALDFGVSKFAANLPSLEFAIAVLAGQLQRKFAARFAAKLAASAANSVPTFPTLLPMSAKNLSKFFQLCGL